MLLSPDVAQGSSSSVQNWKYFFKKITENIWLFGFIIKEMFPLSTSSPVSLQPQEHPPLHPSPLTCPQAAKAKDRPVSPDGRKSQPETNPLTKSAQMSGFPCPLAPPSVLPSKVKSVAARGPTDPDERREEAAAAAMSSIPSCVVAA